MMKGKIICGYPGSIKRVKLEGTDKAVYLNKKDGSIWSGFPGEKGSVMLDIELEII